MAAQFCDNEDCLDSWHCTEFADTPQGCREAGNEKNGEGVVASFFAA